MSKGNTRRLCIVGIVVLYILAWYTLIDDSVKQANEYNGYLQTARVKREQTLYADSNDNYLAALAKNDSIELREEIIGLYKEAGSTDTCLAFCEETIEKYPYEALGYEGLAEIYKKTDNLYTCFSIINKAGTRGIDSEVLKGIADELAYAYELTFMNFEDVKYYCSGLCAVKKIDGYWGYVNPYGSTSVAFKFEEAGAYSPSGLAAVKEQGKYVLVDSTGRHKVVDVENKAIEDCTLLVAGKIAVKYDGKYHYCDENFKELFGSYDYAGTFNCGVAAVMNNGVWNIIDENGNKVCDTNFEDIKVDDKGVAFRSDMAFAKVNGQYVLIDTKGKTVSNEKWDDVDAFNSDQPAAVKKGEMWGFINTNKEVVVDYKYAGAKSFSNGFAAVQRGDEWGYIALEDFEEKIECQFDDANDFNEGGSAFVKMDDTWKLIKIYRLSRKK